MLHGQVVIVTGGATGIGRGIAEVLSRNGANVAIVQPDGEHARTSAETIPRARGFAADISDPVQVDSMVDQVAREFGHIDALVNNASLTGRVAVGSFTDTSAKLVNRIVDVNLKGTIWCSQAVARHMIANARRGVIVHIASVAAFVAQELASIYCATKAAQISLAQSMAIELASYGIRVNAIAPGDIYTESSAEITSELRNIGATGRFWRTTPIGRRGSPQDIGEAAAFLLSDSAAFITGTALCVDGGFLAY